MPLCTIFTKWPAPLGPQWYQPCSDGLGSPVEARDQVRHGDVEQARRGDGEDDRQQLLHVRQREMASQRAHDIPERKRRQG